MWWWKVVSGIVVASAATSHTHTHTLTHSHTHSHTHTRTHAHTHLVKDRHRSSHEPRVTPLQHHRKVVVVTVLENLRALVRCLWPQNNRPNSPIPFREGQRSRCKVSTPPTKERLTQKEVQSERYRKIEAGVFAWWQRTPDTRYARAHNGKEEGKNRNSRDVEWA
jgi:hypothetical protein